MREIFKMIGTLGLISMLSACGHNDKKVDEEPISTNVPPSTSGATLPNCIIKENLAKTHTRITVHMVCKDGDIVIDSASVTLDNVVKNIEYSDVSINDYVGFENLNPDTKYTATYLVIVGGESLEGSLDIRTKNVTLVTSSNIRHNGTTYGLVTSPHTSRVWLDRNLGASQVCTAVNDASCYGNYYQWGRNEDGHQNSVTPNSNVLSNNIYNVGHTSFIINLAAPHDWANIDPTGVLREANWSSIDGSSVCPIGFRVPTRVELRDETTSAVTIGGSTQVVSNQTAFTNFLKIPSSGIRAGNTALSGVQSIGTRGDLWTVTAAGGTSFSFGATSAPSAQVTNFGTRSYGRPVRCIQN